MNYVRYDRQTGDIKGYGYSPDDVIQQEIDNGNAVVFAPDSISDFNNWKVNLETKELERIHPDTPIVIPPEILDLFKNQYGG